MRAALPLEMDPATRAQAYLQLGSALCAQRRFDEGIPAIDRGLAIDPTMREADVILGQAYADRGRDALAVRHLLRALEWRPDVPASRRAAYARHVARSAVRDGAHAASLAERAVRLTSGQDAVAFETLAAATRRETPGGCHRHQSSARARARAACSTASLCEQQRAFYHAGDASNPDR